MRQQGTVRNFEGAFGWITPSSGERVIFIHQKSIIGMAAGYRELFSGDVVEYEVEEDDRGVHAVRCKVIQSAETAA